MNDILIVGDNATIRKHLADILSRAGYTVRPVDSSKAALESYKAEPSSLVILDIAMPDMDGIEMFHALRAMDKQVKVVAISNLCPPYSSLCIKLLGKLGAMATLETPFADEALLYQVRSLLGTTSEFLFAAAA